MPTECLAVAYRPYLTEILRCRSRRDRYGLDSMEVYGMKEGRVPSGEKRDQ